MASLAHTYPFCLGGNKEGLESNALRDHNYTVNKIVLLHPLCCRIPQPKPLHGWHSIMALKQQ